MEGRTYDLARALLDCACARLEAECPTRHCVTPGVPSFENCCTGPTGGQLTVHVVRRFPSRQFPNPDLGTPENCAVPYLVTHYQLTIVRCHPTGGVAGPPCEDLDATAQQVLRDLERIWDATACCLQDREVIQQLVGGPYRWVIGNQEAGGGAAGASTVQPGGGCVGSTLDVLVGVPPCLECP